MSCRKVDGVKALLFVPERVDPEIADLVCGYAEWGIKPQVIQIAGWPWAAVPLEYSPDIAKFLSLWNASRKKSGEKWIIFPSGNWQIIPHPIFWETAASLLTRGQEFGRFLKALPPDSLTNKGFEREAKRLKPSAPAISRLLESLCPQ